jgi:hypothetical protein
MANPLRTHSLSTTLDNVRISTARKPIISEPPNRKKYAFCPSAPHRLFVRIWMQCGSSAKQQAALIYLPWRRSGGI